MFVAPAPDERYLRGVDVMVCMIGSVVVAVALLLGVVVVVVAAAACAVGQYCRCGCSVVAVVVAVMSVGCDGLAASVSPATLRPG